MRSHAFEVRYRLLFLSGVFLFCMCGLMLQIIETRILSVITHYYLAFFAISLAMLGLTAGALIVHFQSHLFPPQQLSRVLARVSALFSVSIAGSILLLITTVVFVVPANLVMTIFIWIKLFAILAPPYVLAGVGISLALTRTPLPIGIVYGVDLGGAAVGCLGVLVVLNFLDGVSAMLCVAAVAAIAAWFFATASELERDQATARSGGPRIGKLGVALALALGLMSLGNAMLHPRGLVLTVTKDAIETPDTIDVIRWNSFSRITAGYARVRNPAMWGPSDAMPATEIVQRHLSIDGAAGTGMYRFAGDPEELGFLRYDVTNLAYYIRNSGRAAVIGVGGGRDLLSAYLFGFRDVIGIEINPVFIRFLTEDFADFNRLTSLPGIRLVVDEARSWFARSRDQFDVIQMSMIDTWAATGNGAYSLSENGLYTIEGWQRFIARLSPTGVFTVSRWYSPGSPDETGRLLSLGRAALFRFGVADPSAHIFLVGNKRLSTLVLARTPFSPEELATLRRVSADLGYTELVGPGRQGEVAVLREIMTAPDIAGLHSLATDYTIDVSPATDERPFFFNQLRVMDLASMRAAADREGGVLIGNMKAFFTLAMIAGLSAAIVFATIIVPALPSLRQTSLGLAAAGTLYFTFIGLGFMFVEIGLIQRLSVFLGHPVYGLAIGLFGIILSTGFGSLLSERVVLRAPAALLAWSAILAAYLGLFPTWFPALAFAAESQPLYLRALVCFVAVIPPGLLMGFAFPTGMRLVGAIDQRPTPWFWAVNGSAGVLAASLAVAVSIAFSINVSVWLGAICYLGVGLVSLGLLALGDRAKTMTALPATS